MVKAARPRRRLTCRFEFGRARELCEGFQSKICWAAAAKREKYLATARLRVANIDKRFVDFCLGIAERAQDSSPVGVAAAPADLHQCAVSDCARSRLSL